MLQLIKGNNKKQYDMKWIRTPKEIWNILTKEFNFTVDACSSNIKFDQTSVGFSFVSPY